MAVLMASHTRSVFSASRRVLPMQDLSGHGGGVGHAGAADGLHQRLLDDALLHVQGQLAGALLRSAPADAVGQTADVLDLLGLNPLAFFRDGGRSVIRALGHRAHTLYFAGIDHSPLSFSIRSEFCRFFQSWPGILTVFSFILYRQTITLSRVVTIP